MLLGREVCDLAEPGVLGDLAVHGPRLQGDGGLHPLEQAGQSEQLSCCSEMPAIFLLRTVQRSIKARIEPMRSLYTK